MPAKIQTYVFEELSQLYLPVVDRTAEFAALNTLHVTSFDAHKNSFMALKTEQFKQLQRTRPVPGGVGFGVYYEKNFQQSFTNIAVLDVSIAVADIIGGNVDNFLYLTATNTTAKGVEAYISYYAQQPAEFVIFDWSVCADNKWKLKLDFDIWSGYLADDFIEDIPVRLLRLLNCTERISNTTWQNVVYFFNQPHQTWDVVYRNAYTLADNSEQKHDHLGSWGPIVETFQKDHGAINAVGFKNARVYNEVVDSALNDINSFVQDDEDDGIEMLLKISNATFLVQ